MADKTGKVENTRRPMAKFYFKVIWDGATIKFSEITGLDTETQIIDYRHGVGLSFPPNKMPSIEKVGNVTMKRGVFVGDTNYSDWYNQIQMNTVKQGRKTIVIQLLNENGKSIMEWTLHNAWPTKITSTDLKSDDNEPAIDTIEIAYERLEIKNQNE